MCAVTAMWNFLGKTQSRSQVSPLFREANGTALKYTTLRSEMREVFRGVGLTPAEEERYGGHSFRVGGAQALALAGHSLEYIMAMGRWRCMDSVLTYVETPTTLRQHDAAGMVTSAGARAAAHVTAMVTKHRRTATRSR